MPAGLMGIDLADIDKSNQEAGLYPKQQQQESSQGQDFKNPVHPPSNQGVLSNAGDAITEGFKSDPVVKYLTGVGQTVRSLAEGDTQMVNKDELSKTYGTKIPYDMTQTEAAMYTFQQQETQQREARIAQFKQEYPTGGMADYALEFAGGMASPENIAAFGLPVWKTGITAATTLGRIGVHALEGGLNVGAFTAATQPLLASQDIAEGRDYTLKDAAKNITYGTFQGLVGGAGLGAIGEALSNKSKADISNFNVATGGQIPIEKAINLTPEMLYKDAASQGVNPHDLANQRVSEVQSILKQNDAAQIEAPKTIESVEPKQAVEDGAPEKSELFDKYMDKAKAMQTALQTAIPCILGNL